ncbi:hypothetical protein MLD38_015834 [Melastoma candidum]|uniref:Uncharacterized protein n=1 Tax=Melastoma candidum TaxID=119954 RepID=A0ACB9RHB4_9MYRT|nr:hypothetical protein MLD38_015834 [Melastoma candidum]
MSCSVCKSCGNRKPQVQAVILDLDGTLLDTERGAKGVLREFLAKYGKVLDEDNKRLGKTLKESAVAFVNDYQLPMTPDEYVAEIVPMYRQKWAMARALPGADRLIKHLRRHGVPFALASNSLREYIEAKISGKQGWKESFSVILGSDEVKSGKPSPDLFLEAARRMGVDATQCLVIEDSLVGAQAGKFAKMKVVAVPSQSEADCSSIADTIIHSLLEFHPEKWGLPPFDDWVNGALPIETLSLTCHHIGGHLYEIKEDDDYILPTQAAGVYFGWAEVGYNGISKVVIQIGYESGPSAMRKLQVCSVDNELDQILDHVLQLTIVGFMHGFTPKDVSSEEAIISEEDKSIAQSSLDLPMFRKCSSRALDPESCSGFTVPDKREIDFRLISPPCPANSVG